MKDPQVTVFVIDDDEAVRNSLRLLLKSVGLPVKMFGSAKEFLPSYDPHQPGCMVLDIRMPGMSGLEAARAASSTRVIFVTAHDEYAVAAFEAAAADYLLKPVSDARLAQCVARLQREAAPPIDLRKLMASLTTPPQPYLSWLTLGLADTTRLVAVRSVLYFRSTEKYTEVVTAHERHLMRTPLRELLASLDPREFAQIHRGTIVNLGAIARVERDMVGRSVVRLKDHADVLPVSRSFAGRFRQM